MNYNPNILNSQLIVNRLAEMRKTGANRNLAILNIDEDLANIDIKDITSTNKLFSDFIDRVKTYYSSFIYIAKAEKSSDGSWRYHLLFSVGQKINESELRSIWANGKVYSFDVSTLQKHYRVRYRDSEEEILIGVIRAYQDLETGEMNDEIIFDEELTEELQKQGYRNYTALFDPYISFTE